MKTIIIINDIPFKEYHPLLNKVLHYIDFLTFDFPITKFDLLNGLYDEKWEEYNDAALTDDFDYYIICLDIDIPYTIEMLNVLEKWANNPCVYTVQASLLNTAFNKDNTLKTFINTPISRLISQ